jgi:hypothetical protein
MGMVKTESGWQTAQEVEQADLDTREDAVKAAVAGFKESEEAARKQAGKYDPYLGFMEGMAEDTPGAMAAARAAAMAPVYGQMGMGAAAASPAAAAVGGQLAINSELKTMAALKAIQEDLLAGRISQNEAEQLAAQAGILSAQAQMEAPTTEELSAKKMNYWQGLWDSGVGRAEMKDRLRFETDPYVKAYWTAKMNEEGV